MVGRGIIKLEQIVVVRNYCYRWKAKGRHKAAAIQVMGIKYRVWVDPTRLVNITRCGEAKILALTGCFLVRLGGFQKPPEPCRCPVMSLECSVEPAAVANLSLGVVRWRASCYLGPGSHAPLPQCRQRSDHMTEAARRSELWLLW